MMLPTPEKSATAARAEPTVGDRQGASPAAEEDGGVLALKALVAKLHREQHKVHNLLSSLGFALRSFNNLNQFLDITPLMAARVADAQGGALILFRQDGQIRLEQVYCQEGRSCHNLQGPFQQVMAQLNRDRPQEGYSCPVNLDEQLRSYLPENLQFFSTPILIQNIERGRLYIFNDDPDYNWSTTRRKLVQLVADQTAVAIANHDLATQLRQKERQDRELEIASEIQSHLLPSQCPQIAGLAIAAQCRTASRVGGDYYDFIPSNYDQTNPQDPANSQRPWSIVIGDVMGKGVPAGLIMTMTRGMLRAEILNGHSPAKILTHLNRVMYADLENSHRFVTLFYSEYDPQGQTLRYSNAAHNPPLWWRAEDRQIHRLDSWGMLIGLDANSEYEDGQVHLSPGDKVLYYTDGLTDAADPQGDRYGEERLIAIFQTICEREGDPKAIMNHLFAEIDQFVGKDHSAGDDLTLVVLTVLRDPSNGPIKNGNP